MQCTSGMNPTEIETFETFDAVREGFARGAAFARLEAFADAGAALFAARECFEAETFEALAERYFAGDASPAAVRALAVRAEWEQECSRVTLAAERAARFDAACTALSTPTAAPVPAAPTAAVNAPGSTPRADAANAVRDTVRAASDAPAESRAWRRARLAAERAG